MARGKRAKRGRGGSTILAENATEEHDESSPPPAKSTKGDEALENGSKDKPNNSEKPSENGLEDSSSPQTNIINENSQEDEETGDVECIDDDEKTEENQKNDSQSTEERSNEEKLDSTSDSTKEKQSIESKKEELDSKPKEFPHLKSILNAGPLPPGSTFSHEICIKNVPQDVSEETLKGKLLGHFDDDDISRIEFATKDEEKVAFVEFKKSLHATDALYHINRLHKNKGSPYVAEIVKAEELLDAPPQSEINVYHRNATRKLFLGNLRTDVTVQLVKNYLLKFGKVHEVVIKRGRTTIYAFISFDSIDSTVKAIKGLQEEAQEHGLGLRVGFGRAKIVKVILVSNLPSSSLDIHDFRKYASYGGYLGFLFLDRDEQQALLFFKTEDAACRSLVYLRGKKLNGQKLMTDFAPLALEKKYIAMLPEKFFDRHGGVDVLRQRSFEIVNNKLTEIRKPLEKKDVQKSYHLEEVKEWLSGRDKEEKESIDPTQLLEIPGYGLYFIKSSFP